MLLWARERSEATKDSSIERKMSSLGLASLGTDVFSFGVLGVLLLTKDSKTSFVNKDGAQEPITNLYLDQWRRTLSILPT